MVVGGSWHEKTEAGDLVPKKDTTAFAGKVLYLVCAPDYTNKGGIIIFICMQLVSVFFSELEKRAHANLLNRANMFESKQRTIKNR